MKDAYYRFVLKKLKLRCFQFDAPDIIISGYTDFKFKQLFNMQLY